MNRYSTSVLRNHALTLSLIALFFVQLSAKSSKLSNGEIACDDLVHISLDESCVVELTPDMVLEDMQHPPYDYIIQVYYNNKLEADLFFGSADIGKKFVYKIYSITEDNSCWGEFLIEDKFPPVLECNSGKFRCDGPTHPFILGLPIPSKFPGVGVTSLPGNMYVVTNWDACSEVKLSYVDTWIEYPCDSLWIRKLERTWIATDKAFNSSTCKDEFYYERPDSTDINYPHDFDDFDMPSIQCSATGYEVLPNGAPAPSHTGYPVPDGCNTLNATFDDIIIHVCDGTFKVIRKWYILDWCAKTIHEHTQLIKVIDNVAPEMANCDDPLKFGMQYYSCLGTGVIETPTVIEDCSTWDYTITLTWYDVSSESFVSLPNTHIVRNHNGSYSLINLPKGKGFVHYHLKDDCGNQSTCSRPFIVVDDLEPIAVCDKTTVVSIVDDGTGKLYAESLNDGSHDNCEIVLFEVRRMEETCDSIVDEFGPYAEFCCVDVMRLTHMVALQITDAAGNKNTCMVEVQVQDKLSPTIIPPSDITISCSFEYSDYSVFGKVVTREEDREVIYIEDSVYYTRNYVAGIDGIAYDNCEVTISDIAYTNIECNSGQIRRVFTATDKQGLQTTRVQVITIINPDPFDESDITWPEKATIHSCANVVVHPNNTGKPVFENVGCAQIAANYKDTKLAIIDSVCFKILRRWTVVDWCQFNVANNTGIWEYVQVIEVKNTVAPDFISCQNLTVCDDAAYYDNKSEQCIGHVDITASAEDDCTEPKDLIWLFEIDYNNDGSYDTTGYGNTVRRTLPVGEHRIFWRVSDQCGNYNTCIQIITLKDCKKPTPYCANGIVTVVMPTTKTIAVWAKDLDINSFDNCTQKDNLKFSFSSDTSHRSILFNCDSMNGQAVITKSVRMYVTDEAGNQEYCEATIRIQDNDLVCKKTVTINAGGNLKAFNNTGLKNAHVALHNLRTGQVSETFTNSNGDYLFKEVEAEEYRIIADKTDNIINGVTTHDIVLIQKHILGIQQFVSPYQYLAADVNKSGEVTASDISSLRQVILGKINAFPNEQKIWRFFDESCSTKPATDAFDCIEEITDKTMPADINAANFVGVKTGDINISAILNGLQQSQSRASQSIIVEKKYLGSEIEYAFIANQDMSLEGMQFSVQLENEHAQVLQLFSKTVKISKDQYVIRGNELLVSHVCETKKSIQKGQVLFVIVAQADNTNETDVFLSQSLVPEMYLANENVPVVFELRTTGKSQQYRLYQNTPNPVSGKTIIGFELPQSEVVNFSFYNMEGKVLFTMKQTGQVGQNQIELQKDLFVGNGVVYYRMEAKGFTEVKKMTIIE